MKCIYCANDDTRVMETRESADATRRRRECLACDRRFTTYERPDNVDIVVVKKDKSKVPFDKEKLLEGMLIACEKRPVDLEQVEAAADEIERMLRRRKRSEVTTREIGSMVLTRLKRLDKVAYMRFASVYREFSDVASFKTELQKII